MRSFLVPAIFAAGALAAPNAFGIPFFGNQGNNFPGSGFGGGNNNNNNGGNPSVATVQATSTVTQIQTQVDYVQTQVTSTYTLTKYMPTETTVFNTWTLTEWEFAAQTETFTRTVTLEAFDFVQPTQAVTTVTADPMTVTTTLPASTITSVFSSCAATATAGATQSVSHMALNQRRALGVKNAALYAEEFF